MSRLDFFGRRCTDLHSCAVVKQNLKGVSIVAHSHAQAVVFAEQRMASAGIISEHPANRAAAVRGRIGTEKKSRLLFGDFAEMIQDASRLNDAKPFVGVDSQDFVHIFRKIDHHGHVAALPPQTAAGPAC